MLEFSERTSRVLRREHSEAIIHNIGEMSWAHRDPSKIPELINYESRLNSIMAAYPQLGLCLYDAKKCGGDMIMSVLKTHPRVMLGGTVFDNPYFVLPSELRNNVESLG